MNKELSIKLKPYLRDIIWGGQKLKKEWNKVSDMQRIAESWELSAYSGMESVAVGGKYDGKTLKELFEADKELFGSAVKDSKEFPILIKLIDACGDLSIQVHPDDDYAYKVEGEPGKTEMWYIADCEKDGAIYYGFNKDVTKEEIANSIKNNTVCDILNKVPVKKGDAFFVNAGTPHAILKGITIIEIQESSNTTYRMYDYDRRGADGKPRALHIDKAIEVLNVKKMPEPFAIEPIDATLGFVKGDSDSKLLASCQYFSVFVSDVEGSVEIYGRDNCFVTFTVADGTLGDYKKGDTAFIPVGGKLTATGNAKLIITTIN